MTKSFEGRVRELLARAGIEIDGSRPWDIQVHDSALYQRVMSAGSVGLGESYMDGWWDAARLDQFFERVHRARLETAVRRNAGLRFLILRARLSNLQSARRAFEVGERHYDLGNDLFEAMLDRRMVYTCGYWKCASTLDEAQEAKLELVCQKIGLRPGMRVLDVGCGWGSFLKYAGERYGAKGVGITVSEEQQGLGQRLCAGLDVEIHLMDYRRLSGTFDRVVSLGMFEHVGYKNYGEFMKIIRGVLVPDGLFLLHTLGRDTSGTTPDPWIHRYIFPNGMLPSIAQIGRAMEGRFVMEDWQNFSADYDPTLMSWFSNFDQAWPTLRVRYGERFYRMWKYFLLAFAGAFRARRNQLWQIVLSPRGVPGGYSSIR